MNDFGSRPQSNGPGSSVPEHLNIDEAYWWKKQSLVPSSQPLNSPLTPLSFAFLNPEQREAFTFPTSPLNGNSNDVVKIENSSTSKKFDIDACSPTSISSSSSSAKKTLQVKDLIIINDEPAPSNGYEPKAHLGWASFGESIHSPAKKVSSPKEKEIAKRKVYVVRPSKNQRSKPYQVANPTASCISKTTKPTNKFPLSKSKSLLKSSNKLKKKDDSATEDDEIVDVVGIDEDEETAKLAMDSGCPPDLPPQRPLGSRFEMQRQRKGSPTQDIDALLRYDKRTSLCSKTSRSTSPPPLLEPQMRAPIGETSSSPIEPLDKDDNPDELVPEEDVIKNIPRYLDHDPTQLLKTRVSSSAIPILPLSKSIMERKKAALEMTKNAVVKKVPTLKNNTKNLTVAPKNVQVPAYAEKTSITLYSNLTKPVAIYGKEGSRSCARCRERNAVDMSSFKFLEDSSVVAVRAHLCDQTRVMIARTALFNREYAKRLGDQAHGTIWQKPDEVTAQMTGFCSATVRRCIDIANLSIVPKCADRIGVSKNELSTLKSAFGEAKFCGQTMRTPHVLSQYYSMKAQAMTSATTSSSKELDPPKEKTPEDLRREEEEKKHHPLSYQINSVLKNAAKVTPSPSTSSSTATTVPKKTVLRWSSIQAPRILRTPGRIPTFQFPRTTVIPVLKAEKEPETVGAHRRRGRPKKDRSDEDERNRPVRTSRRLRTKRNIDIEDAVRETVDHLVASVVEMT